MLIVLRGTVSSMKSWLIPVVACFVSKPVIFRHINSNCRYYNRRHMNIVLNRRQEDASRSRISLIMNPFLNLFPHFTQQSPRFSKGFVVGFCGAKVFCLQYNTVTTIEISQSAPMIQYMESKQFE